MDQDRRMMGPRDIEAIMFVPHTPREELRKRLQAKEDELSKMFGQARVKIIERAGTALENLLCSKNPWRCVGGQIATCAGKGVRAWVIYSLTSLTCQVCARKGVRKSYWRYWGETGRSAFKRCREHRELWRNKKERKH